MPQHEDSGARIVKAMMAAILSLTKSIIMKAEKTSTSSTAWRGRFGGGTTLLGCDDKSENRQKFLLWQNIFSLTRGVSHGTIK